MIDILNSSPVFQKISTQELKGIQAYKISKMLSIIQKQINLYNDARDKLLKECCIKNDDGLMQVDQNGQVTLQQDKIKYFNQEIDKVLHVYIELNIPLLQISDLEQFILTPEDINKIQWWIEE